MDLKVLSSLIQKFVDDMYPSTGYNNPSIDQKIEQSGYDALRDFALWLENFDEGGDESGRAVN